MDCDFDVDDMFWEDVASDGNCFYRFVCFYFLQFLIIIARTIASAVYGNQNRHSEVRQELMEFLLASRNKPFARFFSSIVESEKESFVSLEDYCDYYSQTSKGSDRWGQTQQLLLAAKIYDRNFILFQPNEQRQFKAFSVNYGEVWMKQLSMTSSRINLGKTGYTSTS